MATMYATVLDSKVLLASTLPNGDVLAESISFRLSVKMKSKLASASIYWLTLPSSETDLKVGDKEELDSNDFYAVEKQTSSGNTIKILKAKGLEII